MESKCDFVPLYTGRQYPEGGVALLAERVVQ